MEIRSLDELTTEGARFAKALAPKAQGATLVALAGDLGAGKTAFVQTVAKALGVEEPVTSPTFVLEKVYQLPTNYGHRRSIFKRLAHIDAYRLEGAAELAPLGFEELMQDATTLVMLEWPEKVGITDADVRIMLKANDDGSHTMTYA